MLPRGLSRRLAGDQRESLSWARPCSLSGGLRPTNEHLVCSSLVELSG
jgi:hypothetical protein